MLRLKEDGNWKGNASVNLIQNLKTQLQNEKAIKSGDLVIIATGMNYKPV